MHTHLLSFLAKPRLVLIFLIVITFILGLGIPKLEVRNNFDGELPEEDPITLEFNRVKNVFSERPTLLVGIETEDIYNPTTLQKIKDLTSALEYVPYVLRDEIKSLATLKKIRQRAWGIDLSGFLDTIPTHPVALIRLREDVESNKIIAGKYVSMNGDFAIISANLEDDYEGATVLAQAKQLLARFEGKEKLHLSGAPVIVEDVQKGISSDSKRLIPYAILLVFLGFYISFKRLRATLLPAIMVITSIIWTMGFMGYMGLPITVVSNALPVIMVAVASSYGIHFMNSYYHFSSHTTDRGKVVEKTVNQIGQPIFITGVTSALGSASLLIFQITSLREFGIIGAAGFIFATVLCLTLLPSLSMLLPVQSGAKTIFDRMIPIMQKVTVVARQHKWFILLFYLMVIPLAAIASQQIQIGDDYTKFFPAKHESRVAAEVFNDKLSGARSMEVMLHCGDYASIKDADFFQRLTAFQSSISLFENVGSVHSYVDIIYQLKNNFMDDSVRAVLNEEISQFLMLFEMSADPGDVFTLYDDNYEFAKIKVFIKSSNPEDHKKIYREIQESHKLHFPPNTTDLSIGGDVVNRLALSKYIVSGKIKNIILAVVFVLITCSFLMRSLRKGIITIIPIILSLLTIFGCMGLLGIRLGISTSLLTAMVVGIGIDFAVHYQSSYYRFRENNSTEKALNKTANHTGKAIFFDAISNIAGFSILSFSGFLPVQHFGWLLAFSMLIIFLNTVVLFPSIFSLKKVHIQNKASQISLIKS